MWREVPDVGTASINEYFAKPWSSVGRGTIQFLRAGIQPYPVIRMGQLIINNEPHI